jgi:galactose-1-phosphate uridylyltransferase
MTVNRHIYFLSDVGKEKSIYQDSNSICPFCNREELSDILDEKDGIVLLKNKFSTLANTYQTVLIETKDCLSNMSTYDRAHMRKIISFGIDNWLTMEESREFKSVVFYKNHGPLSGGSINHAHMQIVGLKDIDYKLNLKNDIFEGIEIYKEGNSLLNISTKPNACSVEFNIITTPRNDNFMADNIQNIVKYILKQCDSFNLFFYQWEKSIICKIVPRYITSPFFVGFSIPQVTTRIKNISEEIQRTYYSVKHNIKERER